MADRRDDPIEAGLPGHYCELVAELASMGATGPQPAPFTDEPQRAMESLAVLLPTKATWVLPGHGMPFDGCVEAAAS